MQDNQLFGKSLFLRFGLSLGDSPEIQIAMFEKAVEEELQALTETYTRVSDDSITITTGNVFLTGNTKPKLTNRKLAIPTTFSRKDTDSSIISCELTIFSDGTFEHAKIADGQRTGLGNKSLQENNLQVAFIELIDLLQKYNKQ